MTKEDLVIGKKYRNGFYLVELYGFAKDDSVALIPLESCDGMLMYDKNDELVDPMYKSGTFGLELIDFLELYKEA